MRKLAKLAKNGQKRLKAAEIAATTGHNRPQPAKSGKAAMPKHPNYTTFTLAIAAGTRTPRPAQGPMARGQKVRSAGFSR